MITVKLISCTCAAWPCECERTLAEGQINTKDALTLLAHMAQDTGTAALFPLASLASAMPLPGSLRLTEWHSGPWLTTDTLSDVLPPQPVSRRHPVPR